MKNTVVIKKEGNTIYINTDKIITTKEERLNFPLVYGVVSAVFQIKTDHGVVIPIVKRSKDAKDYPNKWALLPAGGIDCIVELHCPNIAMEREIYEELHLFQNDEYFYPLMFHHKDTDVTIYDERVKKKYHAYGEFFECKQQLFLIATFKSDRVFELDKFIVFDGEKNDQEEYLHRDVALILEHSSLSGKVKPIARFKKGARAENHFIDLNGFQTPTLEYLRKKWILLE